MRQSLVFRGWRRNVIGVGQTGGAPPGEALLARQNLLSQVVGNGMARRPVTSALERLRPSAEALRKAELGAGGVVQRRVRRAVFQTASPKLGHDAAATESHRPIRPECAECATTGRSPPKSTDDGPLAVRRNENNWQRRRKCGLSPERLRKTDLVEILYCEKKILIHSVFL